VLERSVDSSARFSTRDLATFNRWLCVTRVRAALAVTGFVLVLDWLGIGAISVRPALGICGALLLLSAAGLTARRLHSSFAFLFAQTVADLGAITAGIGLSASGEPALLLRPMYMMVIVPTSLISAPIGLAAAAAATINHGLLLALERASGVAMLGSLEFLAPAFLFFLVAQQSFFYSDHLELKNRALADLAARLRESKKRLAEDGRLSADLAEAARQLSTTLDAPRVMAHVNRTACEQLCADWGATFLVDSHRGTFRLASATDPQLFANELGRIEFPLGSWPVIERLRRERVLALTGPEAARVPILFTGERLLSTVLLAPLDRDGNLVGFLAVGYSATLVAAREWAAHLLAGIAEHAAIVLENARLLEEIREANRLKSEFVGAVSHELRSPLNVILGYLEMALDEGLGPVTEGQRDALHRTRVQSLHLLEMITALLDLNRFEAGRLPLQLAPVAVGPLLAEVCDQVPDTWRRREVKLALDVADDVPVIHTDFGKLKTVVRNLVHNALKFTERGAVTVTAIPTPTGGVSIAVADTGRGIPPDAIGYIFDMFRQAPGGEGGGVGLGLHLVRRFVEALGGEVTVASELGVGTRFTIVLPGPLTSGGTETAGGVQAAAA